MIDKINKQEIDKFYKLINEKKISVELIKALLKLETIGDMDKLQYNYLLLILNQLSD